MKQLTAGGAQATITPPVGTAMDGYSARQSVSTGVHDDLHARALVLDDGATRLAIISCDLIGVDRRLVARARELIEASTGIPPANVMIAATHTHHGPAGLRPGGTGSTRAGLDEALVEVTARQVAGAVATADGTRRPAALKTGRAKVDSVSQNRRAPDWPIETDLRVLLFDSPEPLDGPVAAVISYACHPTVMNFDNLLLSADYPGVAVRTLQQVLPGLPCLFLNGACGNVNPVWMEQRFEEVERVGSIVGAAAARLAQELRPLGRGQGAHNIRWSEVTEKPVTAGRLVEPVRLRAASRNVDLPLRALLSPDAYEERVGALEKQVAALPGNATPVERHDLVQLLTRFRMERAIQRRAAEGAAQNYLHPEVQALSLGAGAAILALPGEFFVETGEQIEAASGVSELVVACYANHYVGYVVPAEAYDQGGYEAGVTPFDTTAEATIKREALEVLREVTGG